MAVRYSLVRSPARLPLGLALVRGGSGLSLWFEIRVSVLSSLCFPLRNVSSARRGLARDATPSFRETDLSSESPLNIRAGPHPGRTGTRLSGRIRETGRGGLVELASDQTSSSNSANAMLPPGPMGPAQVKSCERYRSDRQGSILPIPMHGSPNPEGQTLPLRFRTREGGWGLTGKIPNRDRQGAAPWRASNAARQPGTTWRPAAARRSVCAGVPLPVGRGSGPEGVPLPVGRGSG